MNNVKVLLLIITFFSLSCSEQNESNPETGTIEFGTPQPVSIQGYNNDIMEPFLTRDGSFLFFNNLNVPSVNTNLHWCTKINDTLFQYEGELENINTESLEGVPTMDSKGNLYYIHTGTYNQTLSTIYKGKFSSGSVTNSELVQNISLEIPGWLNFDVEVSDDGNTLYFVDGRFDSNGGPYEANLVMAKRTSNNFIRSENSDEIFQDINTGDLEYAAAISKNELEILFTRVAVPFNSNSEPKIFIATRNNIREPFSNVDIVSALTGFVEGATYSPDDKGIYFHKKENGTHNLYFAKKL